MSKMYSLVLKQRELETAYAFLVDWEKYIIKEGDTWWMYEIPVRDYSPSSLVFMLEELVEAKCVYLIEVRLAYEIETTNKETKTKYTVLGRYLSNKDIDLPRVEIYTLHRASGMFDNVVNALVSHTGDVNNIYVKVALH